MLVQSRDQSWCITSEKESTDEFLYQKARCYTYLRSAKSPSKMKPCSSLYSRSRFSKKVSALWNEPRDFQPFISSSKVHLSTSRRGCSLSARVCVRRDRKRMVNIIYGENEPTLSLPSTPHSSLVVSYDIEGDRSMRARDYSLSPGRPPLERMTVTYFRRARSLLCFPRDWNEPSSHRKNNDRNNRPYIIPTSPTKSSMFVFIDETYKLFMTKSLIQFVSYNNM